ncbi:hypothetical protein UA32_11795 [Photobacterium angustum]|uniref:Uncharacterized protein n=1 Tax=Photobacterium angustum TaxID=661 RepID=A0ABX5H1C6_PHOAN|nr:hypothetical protein [Photobacterium angustum]KJG37644.1 hypothetical protein UA32_11795 [Photobacterium angustum]PSX07099.1 hypothetical protein C0W27_16140 [Photobacterium angustum]
MEFCLSVSTNESDFYKVAKLSNDHNSVKLFLWNQNTGAFAVVLTEYDDDGVTLVNKVFIQNNTDLRLEPVTPITACIEVFGQKNSYFLACVDEAINSAPNILTNMYGG